MALVAILALLVNLAVIQAGTEVGTESSVRAGSHVHFDVYASALAKAHYNPWFCNYFKEPGYKCTDCNTAFHCFPGNFALIIQCSGRTPFCSNGYCTETKSEKCYDDPNRIKNSKTEADNSKDEKTLNDNPQA